MGGIRTPRAQHLSGRLVVWLALGVLMVLPIAGRLPRVEVAAAASTGVTVKLLGAPGDRESFNPSISADGRFVAFESASTNLVPGDTNNNADVFVKDMATGATIRVSTDSSGAQIGGGSDPSMSADGRFVAFRSDAAELIPDNPRQFRNIFIKDIVTGETIPVSTNASGEPVSADFGPPRISADGRFVTFESNSPELVPGQPDDPVQRWRVFVKDMSTGKVTCAATTASGKQNWWESSDPWISGDGRYVVLESEDTDLVPDGKHYNPIVGYPGYQIFRKDIITGRIIRVAYHAVTPTISADGSHVAHLREHAGWVSVKDLNTGKETLASTPSSGKDLKAGTDERAAISADGRFVAFSCPFWDLIPGDSNYRDNVFVKDAKTGKTSVASSDSSGHALTGQSGTPAISADGRYVAFRFYDPEGDLPFGIFVKDRSTGVTTCVSTASSVVEADVAAPVFSAPSAMFVESAEVTITCETFGATIRYTTDGSDPTMSSSPYTGPLHLTASVTRLAARAFMPGLADSAVTRTKFYRDSDGDSLPDEWETKGIDTNDDGVIEVDLPAMGADPMRKDIFIQIDWMKTEPTITFPWAMGGSQHKPKPEALAKVIKAFSEAPVDNPNGSHGISLHVDAGTQSIMDPRTGEVWGDRSMSRFITETENLDVRSGDWAAADAIKNKLFTDRAAAFHYCLFVHGYGGGDSTGLSRGIPGGDFIVADGASGGNLDVTAQAGTLMHELGHNLGLHHGGNDEVWYKPNYLSVMNYSFQLSGLLLDRTFGSIDYSRDKLDPLAESSLDERAGIGPKSAVGALGTVYTRNGKEDETWTWMGWTSAPYRVDSLAGSIDWNAVAGSGQSRVDVDLNTGTGKHDPKMVRGQTLTGFNDWEHITYGGGTGHAIGPVVDPSFTAEAGAGTSAAQDTAEPEYADLVKQGLVLRDFRVTVAGDGAIEGPAGAAGTTVRFTVTNSGTTTDTYQISLVTSATVDVASVPRTIELAPGGSRQIDVGVGIPAGATSHSALDVVLTAASVGSPGIIDQAVVVVTVRVPTSTSESGTIVWAIAAGVGIVALGVAVVAVLLARRRRRKRAATSGEGVVAVPTEVAEQAHRVAGFGAPVRYCAECGSLADPVEGFCRTCGSRLTE